MLSTSFSNTDVGKIISFCFCNFDETLIFYVSWDYFQLHLIYWCRFIPLRGCNASFQGFGPKICTNFLCSDVITSRYVRTDFRAQFQSLNFNTQSGLANEMALCLARLKEIIEDYLFCSLMTTLYLSLTIYHNSCFALDSTYFSAQFLLIASLIPMEFISEKKSCLLRKRRRVS